MDPVLIGLNGVARSGKDTGYSFIDEWARSQGGTARREAFADRLKVSAAASLGIAKDAALDFCNRLKGDGSYIQIRQLTAGGGPNTLVHSLTGREFLQYYGTEAHREVFHSDFWVDALLPELDASRAEGTLTRPRWQLNFVDEESNNIANICVVTDVRFENEARRIKSLGGVVWNIDRDVPGAGNHASEQSLSPELIDVIIDNNGSLDDYKDNLAIALEDLIEVGEVISL